MCVLFIANKPLTQAEIQQCHDSNPHGLGMGWLNPSTLKLEYRRGLSPKAFFDLQNSGEVTYPYMGHARWRTSGASVPELNHPFPVGIDALFGNKDGQAHQLLGHNGVWGSYESWMPTWLPQKVQDALSDTAVAAYVADFFPEIIEEISWACCLMSVKESQVHFKLTGTWQTHNGNQFTNLQWLPSNYHNKWSSSPYASENDYNSSGEWWKTWKGRDWRAWQREKDEISRREAVVTRARIAAAKARIAAKRTAEGRQTALVVRKKGDTILAQGKTFALVGKETGFDDGACTLEDLGPGWEDEADFSDLFDHGTRDPWGNDETDLLERQDYASWEEYVETKYGARVARMALIIDPDGSELSNSELESLALSNVGADDLEFEEMGDYGFVESHERGDGEFEDVTEVVSEDYQVVNEYLKKLG